MPLPAERQPNPRFDGSYVDVKTGREIVFDASGAVTISPERGTWSSESGALTVRSSSWDCEGSLGLGTLYLLASPTGDHRQREEWELEFVADLVPSDDSPPGLVF